MPNYSEPNGEITDDELVAEWKKIFEDRNNKIAMIGELEQSIEKSNNNNFQIINGLNNLTIIINEIEVCITFVAFSFFFLNVFL
jgi:hypothetical protein